MAGRGVSRAPHLAQIAGPGSPRWYDIRMPELILTARRVGDHESRTEEYELTYSLGEDASRELQVKYQAARAYEINAALDAAVEASREVIAKAYPEARQPTDERLSQFAWRTIQASKYEAGEPVVSRIEL
jgi:hypothetical protein